MATDPGSVGQDGAAEGAAASSEARESGGGSIFDRAIRTVSGLFASDDASDAPKEQASTPAEPASDPDRVTLTREEYQRAVQSAKDREIARERRDWAVERASQGDLAPIRQMAEKGDRWAQSQLAEQGDTWALGEIKAAEIAAARAHEGMAAEVTGLATHFDTAYLEPLLAALPDQTEAARLRATTVGIDGRQQTTQTVLAALEKHWRAEGAKAAEAALRRNPAVLKQVVLGERASREEPDEVVGVGAVGRDSPDARIRAAVFGR